jgi:hypothetical protein
MNSKFPFSLANIRWAKSPNNPANQPREPEVAYA